MTDKPGPFLLCVLLLVFLLAPVVSPKAQEVDRLRGFGELGYRYRSDGDTTDQDLTQALSLDYFRPWKRLGSAAEVGVTFYGLMQEDVDGLPEDDEFDPFREVADSYRDGVAGWVYLAYAEARSFGFLSEARLGRQEEVNLEPVAFDGGLVTVKPRKMFEVTAFGGVPVNLFEEYEDRQGDSVAGGYLDWRLMKNLSVLLGYMNLRDELMLLDGSEKTVEEGLAVGQVSYRFRRNVRLLARATMLDDELRDATARANYSDYDRDFRVSACYYKLFITREAETYAEDPFSIVLGDYQPYHQGDMTVYKGVGERLGVEAGATLRELEDYDDETIYNHTYERYYASLYLHKIPFRTSRWVAGADLWSAPGDAYDRSYRAEYSQKLGERGKVQAGTSYSLFKVDEVTGEEDEDVQYYYVGLTVPVMSRATFRVDYSFEDGSLREVDTLKARFKYEF